MVVADYGKRCCTKTPNERTIYYDDNVQPDAYNNYLPHTGFLSCHYVSVY